jgi:hypothetical protein
MTSVDLALKRATATIARSLPGYGGAVIVINDRGEIAMQHNMDPIKLAVVLGKLTEELVKEAKLIRLEVSNGANEKGADRPIETES